MNYTFVDVTAAVARDDRPPPDAARINGIKEGDFLRVTAAYLPLPCGCASEPLWFMVEKVTGRSARCVLVIPPNHIDLRPGNQMTVEFRCVEEVRTVVGLLVR